MNVRSFLAGGLIAGLLLVPAGWAYAFTDTDDHWASVDIDRLVTLDAIGGYEDGSFRPDNTITRAEFAKILCKSLALPLSSERSFSDTADHWAKDDIDTLVAQQILMPSEYGGVYAPDTPITRSEIAVMMVRAHGLDERARNLTGISTGFADDAIIASYNKGYLSLARQLEFVGGYEDGTFRPQATATRAEASAMIVRLLDARSAAPSTPPAVNETPTTTTPPIQSDIVANGLQFLAGDIKVSTPQTTNSLGEQICTTTFTLRVQNTTAAPLMLSPDQLRMEACYAQNGQHRYAPVLLDDFSLTIPAGGSTQQIISAHTILPTSLAAHLAFGTTLTGYEVTYQGIALPALSTALTTVHP